MTFKLLPTIDIMLELYRKPRNFERFKEYLKLLEGNTNGDVNFPISGFNPMAKDYVIQKLGEIKDLGGEKLIAESLQELNSKFADHPNKDVFKVALNVSDDLGGGWTNRYTSDYDSKFKITGMVKRKFCTPVLWTSELYTPELIQARTYQYVARTVYWLTHPKPITLEDHIRQERFVWENTAQRSDNLEAIGFMAMDDFYNKNKSSDSYQLIFNFLYGDKASASLDFPCYGIPGEMTGFKYTVHNIRS